MTAPGGPSGPGPEGDGGTGPGRTWAETLRVAIALLTIVAVLVLTGEPVT